MTQKAERFMGKINSHIDAMLSLKSEREAFTEASRVINDCLANGGKLVIFGNGGSAADSQHFAAEVIGRFRRDRRALPAVALTTDSSALTAIGNDFGFESIFSRQIEGLCSSSDVAIGLTTSGSSVNVKAGFEAARNLGVFTIAMTGKAGSERLGSSVDLVLMVDSDASAIIQEAHLFLYHALCEEIDEFFVAE